MVDNAHQAENYDQCTAARSGSARRINMYVWCTALMLMVVVVVVMVTVVVSGGGGDGSGSEW
jgi:t-SNARE complex subunit (syntaxin)